MPAKFPPPDSGPEEVDRHRRPATPTMTGGHVDRWTLAEQGECWHCGTHAPVFVEPFSGKDACRPCWEQIVFGEGE